MTIYYHHKVYDINKIRINNQLILSYLFGGLCWAIYTNMFRGLVVFESSVYFIDNYLLNKIYSYVPFDILDWPYIPRLNESIVKKKCTECWYYFNMFVLKCDSLCKQKSLPLECVCVCYFFNFSSSCWLLALWHRKSWVVWVQPPEWSSTCLSALPLPWRYMSVATLPVIFWGIVHNKQTIYLMRKSIIIVKSHNALHIAANLKRHLYLNSSCTDDG